MRNKRSFANWGAKDQKQGVLFNHDLKVVASEGKKFLIMIRLFSIAPTFKSGYKIPQ